MPKRGYHECTSGSVEGMGSSSSASSSVESVAGPVDLSSLSAEEQCLPPFFAEILVELSKYQRDLGGIKNFPDGRPSVERKVKAEEFRSSYTDYEYVYMTVLGLAKLHVLADEIVQLNNGQVFNHNPGVRLLERSCGMTMHADRDGSNSILRSAGTTLLEAFRLAHSSRNGVKGFFKQAFDRKADPCLEGRVSRLLEYLEANKPKNPGEEHLAPWEDVSLQPIAEGASARDIVGEHMRVFCNECTWMWARERGVSYESAKAARMGADSDAAADFARLYNAEAFVKAAHGRRIVAKSCNACWEALAEADTWSPYDGATSAKIEEAYQTGKSPVLNLRLGPHAWRYEIDLAKLVQRNPKTGKERPLRRTEVAASSPSSSPASASGQRKVSDADLAEAVRYFVDMETIPASMMSL
eukprot:TRINITY_DN40104_c0_g1_i1.p1 TRINITY_DN40104_c0_g1~~TRINITY_DN40104_c0_g1_i1.p1  ORF type:complete len:412 (+),score=75.52 TRINITY_DN40104_c0_g1_i1:20-1255(+)